MMKLVQLLKRNTGDKMAKIKSYHNCQGQSDTHKIRKLHIEEGKENHIPKSKEKEFLRDSAT